MENNTWSIAKVKNDVKELPVKWVFAVKQDEKGKPVRHKARLVTGGHKQIFGVDYMDIYAAVARSQTIRILLSYATFHDWEVRQIDYTTAFLNGDLDKTIYIKKPEGLNLIGINLKEGEKLKLERSLYGLKQAPRQ